MLVLRVVVNQPLMKKLLLATTVFAFGLVACDRNEIPDYDVRDEYVGMYDVTDACDAMLNDYTLEVYKGSSYDEIVFGWPGLYEAGMDVTGIVTGMKVVIPIQQFTISTYPNIFYEFSGSASLEDSILTVDYTVLTVQDGLIIDEHNCIATMERN